MQKITNLTLTSLIYIIPYITALVYATKNNRYVIKL